MPILSQLERLFLNVGHFTPSKERQLRSAWAHQMSHKKKVYLAICLQQTWIQADHNWKKRFCVKIQLNFLKSVNDAS